MYKFRTHAIKDFQKIHGSHGSVLGMTGGLMLVTAAEQSTKESCGWSPYNPYFSHSLRCLLPCHRHRYPGIVHQARARVQSLVLPNFLLPWGCLFWFPESVTPSDRRASQNLWLSSIFRINEEYPIAQSVMRAMHCADAYCLDQIWQAENFRSTRRRLFLEISSAHGRASLYSAGFLSVCNYCLLKAIKVDLQ